MPTAPITDDDERLHPVEDPSPHWSDSLYFNAWDPATNAFLMSRIAVRANEPAATAGMIVWVDGVPVYGYGRDRHRGAADRLGRDGHRGPHVPDARVGAGLGAPAVGPRRRRQGAPRVARPQPRHALQRPPERPAPPPGRLGALRADLLGPGRPPRRRSADRVRRVRPARPLVGVPALGRPRPVALGHGVPRGRPRASTSSRCSSTTGPRASTASSTGPTATTTSWPRRASSTAPTTAAPSRTASCSSSPTGPPSRWPVERGGFSIPVHPAPDQPVTVHETPMRLTAADGTVGYGIYEHLVTDRG